MLGTLDRLARARELRDTVLNAGAVSDTAKRVVLRRKADGLRDLLLGRRTASIDSLDLFNPGESVALLRAHFDALDGPQREDAAPYASIAGRYLMQVAGQAGEAAEIGGAAAALMRDASQVGVEHSAAFRGRHYESLKSAGADAVQQLLDATKAQRRELEAIAEADAERRIELDRRWEATRDRLRPFRKAVDQAIEDEMAGKITHEEYKAIVQAYYDADTEVMNEISAWETTVVDDLRARRDAADQALRTAVSDTIRGVYESSPVTREAAEEWAQAQTITPGAVARLRKMGYDPKAVRADMAEFYRLTGGRLARVTIRTTGGRRASAEGIHGHASSVINLGSCFGKRVLFHELAHHMEADPLVVAAAKGFLEARRTSDRVVRLRTLTGNSAYRADEVAYEDHWFDHYVGKVYNYDVTEVFSMGLESFCDAATLADRAQKDPDMFSLMMGFLKNAPHPLYGVVKQIRAQTAEADAEVAEEGENEREDAIARLAADVEFTHDPEQAKRDFGYTINYYKGVYVGSFEGIDRYDCKALRDPRTKRKKAGVALVRGELRNPDDPQSGMGFQWLALFGGDVEAKATARAWARSGRAAYLTTPQAAKQAAEAYAT